MKTDLTTPGSYLQTQARDKALKDSAKKLGPAALPDFQKRPAPDYKVELSSKTTSPPSSSVSGASLPTPPMPSLPSLGASKPGPTVDDILKEEVKEKGSDKLKARATQDPEIKVGTLKKPAIIFIKGLDVFSSPVKSETGYAGVGKIAESIEGSRIYGWDQKDEIIEEVMKVHKDWPVILVGHSFGGDTAVEVVNELDSLENKFRPVDLLVTIDSIGFKNDIIPQNVKNHLNVFGESSLLLNDGPHVARRNDMTKVTNILSPLDHMDIDDSKEVQYEIVNVIQKALGPFGAKEQT